MVPKLCLVRIEPKTDQQAEKSLLDFKNVYETVRPRRVGVNVDDNNHTRLFVH